MPKKIDLNDPRYIVEETPSRINLSDTRYVSDSQLPPPPEVSLTESALRGGAQGVSFGFPDEATARLESITKNVPYEQALKESRDAYKRAQEANPITYTLSEIAGGVLPAFVPGGVIAKAGQLVSKIPLAGRAIQSLSAMSPLAKGVVLGGTTGAVTGLGMSEGQDIGEVVRDVGIGTALGGALPVIPTAARYALEKAKPILDTGIKSVISAATGKGSQYLEKLERNPEQIKRMERIFTETAPEEISKLSNQLADVATIDPFAKRALAYSKKSYKILDNAGDNIKIDRNLITDYLNNLSANKIKSTAKIDKYIGKELSKRADDIMEKYPETLNGREAKRLIQEIDKDRKVLLPGRGKQLSKEDLEILIRLTQIGGKKIYIWEEPLMSWKETKTSNYNFLSSYRVAREVIYICKEIRKISKYVLFIS